jgi:hypothetical protein
MSKHKGSDQRNKGADQRQQGAGQNRDSARPQEGGAHDRGAQQVRQHQHGHEAGKPHADEHNR